ncbi:unnamed protein product [Calypogeia fissa]
MAQPNSEQNREQSPHPYERVDSSASTAGNGGLANKNEQNLAGEEQKIDFSEVEDLHEPPTSCVGYGGGSAKYHESPNMPNQGYWDSKSLGDNDEESRYGKDTRNGGVANKNEQNVAGEEQNIDFSEVEDLHEPPTSCVGYGGGDSKYHESPNMPNQGYWDSKSLGDNDEESRYGKDTRGSHTPSYGTVNPNASPSEAGFGSSSPGGYPDEGDYNLGDASSRQSGVYGRRRGPIDESSVSGSSEVRDGVRHGMTEEGVASGAGVTDGFGGSSTPTLNEVEQHQYHLAEVDPSQQKESPYSQLLTEADGPSEGSRDRFHEEEGITGNTIGGTAVDHQKEPEEGHPEGEGLLKKLMHKLSGKGQKDEETDSTSDAKGVGSGILLEEDEDETPDCVGKLKDKLLPNHDKHHDEIDPAIFN